MTEELVTLFRRNFPYVIREDSCVRKILDNAENRIFERRDPVGNLIGAAVVRKQTVYMLCVDEAYRGRGIGSELLAQAESCVREAGFATVKVGVGDDYLTPGVPTDRAYGEILGKEAVYPKLDGAAAEFFVKRGYVHAWGNEDCFDMRFPMKEFVPWKLRIGDTVDGITYRFATTSDIPEIRKCTDNAQESFTEYYLDPEIYDATKGQYVLVALDRKTVCGTLRILTGVESAGVGSIGCTTVHEDWRGRHIAVNMVRLGTAFLFASGMTDAYLGYTYTGLDRLYGYAGYKICTYYMMAEKKL